MLQRIEQLIDSKTTFAFETTLSTLSYAGMIERCRKKGYTIVMLFLWLSSPELAIESVRDRVSKGGHNIPEDVIRRRYGKGLKNFVDLFMPLCDEWMLADNSANMPEPVAEGIREKAITIYRPSVWNNILEYGTKK